MARRALRKSDTVRKTFEKSHLNFIELYRRLGNLQTLTDVTVSILSYPVENNYADVATMLGDQGSQTLDYFQYVIDIDTYYQYLGTTEGLLSDYRELTADEVTIIQGKTIKPIHENYADLATMYLLASQRKQKTGWIYRVNNDNSFYEYLGTRNGDATDYIQIGGGAATGLEYINEGGNNGWRLIGRNALNFGDIGAGAIDFSSSSGAC
jgi:hypothetical protein